MLLLKPIGAIKMNFRIVLWNSAGCEIKSSSVYNTIDWDENGAMQDFFEDESLVLRIGDTIKILEVE